MNSESAKRQHLKREIAKRIESIDITTLEKVANVFARPKKWKVIEESTVFPSDKEVETRKFVICFDYFNWNTCHLDQFNPTRARKLLQILESVSKCEVSKFPALKLVRDTITKTPPYESLFANLTPDVTKICETEFCDGRIFFFVTEPYFNIVSIETIHRNLG
jgi:hypothetical protein